MGCFSSFLLCILQYMWSGPFTYTYSRQRYALIALKKIYIYMVNASHAAPTTM